MLRSLWIISSLAPLRREETVRPGGSGTTIRSRLPGLCGGLLTFCAVVGAHSVLAPAALAQTSVWNGGSGTWSTPTAWTGGVPGAKSTVLIDNGNPLASTVFLNVDASVFNVSLDSDDTLTLEGYPDSATSLTVGSAALNGTTNLQSGAILTLQGSAVNSGFLNLSTTSFGSHGITFVVESEINGAGPLVNQGVVSGAGTIATNIDNQGIVIVTPSGVQYGNSLIDANGGILTLTGNVDNTPVNPSVPTNALSAEPGATLALVGAHVTGGVFTGGQLTAINGATVQNMGFTGVDGHQAQAITLTGGSSLGIIGTVTNYSAGLTLGSGGQGAAITGTGVLINQTAIDGSGTISTDIMNQGVGGTGGAITADGGNLVLKGNITNAATRSDGLFTANGGTLVLDGAHVTGGFFGGGQLTAMNGATVQDMGFTGVDGHQAQAITLTGGSSLGIIGTVTNYSAGLTLGSGGQGASLTGSGVLVNQTTIDGGGTLNVAIINNGTITADNASAPLVILGNITDPNSVSVLRVASGATMTLDPVTVNAQIVDVAGTLNGVGTINVNDNVANGGKLAPGLGAPGLLTINGTYTQSNNGTETGVLDFLLGGGQSGQYSQLDVNGFALFDTGSIIEADFYNFDPGSDCAHITGVCETFDVLHLTTGFIETVVTNPFLMTTTDVKGISGLDFDLPTLASGLTWSELDLNNDHDLVLEITSSGVSSGSGGSTTPTPEPTTLLLLGAGLVALAARGGTKRSRESEV